MFDQASKLLRATKPTAAVLREIRDRPEGEQGSEAKQAVLTAMQFAQQSLLLYRLMQHLWKLEHLPGSWLPSIDADAMGLAATTVSCISRWVEQLPAPAAVRAGAARAQEQQGPWMMLAVVSDVACVAVTECARRRTLEQEPAQRWWLGLMSTPEYLRALSCALFYYVNANLTREGSSKQASGRQQQQQQGQELTPWAAACQEAAALPPKQQQLLQALGCGSGRGLLWSNLEADEVGKPAPFIVLFALLAAYGEVMNAEAESMSGSLPRVVRAPEVLRETPQLHQSLLGLLLHFAASLPRLDGEHAAQCLHICDAVRAALQGVTQAHSQQLQGSMFLLQYGLTFGSQPAGQLFHKHPFEGMTEYVPLTKQLLSACCWRPGGLTAAAWLVACAVQSCQRRWIP